MFFLIHELEIFTIAPVKLEILITYTEIFSCFFTDRSVEDN